MCHKCLTIYRNNSLYIYNVKKTNVYLNLFISTQKEQWVKTSPVFLLFILDISHPNSFHKTFGKNDMKISKRQLPSLGFKTIVIKIELTLLANTLRSSATAYMTGRALRGQKKQTCLKRLWGQRVHYQKWEWHHHPGLLPRMGVSIPPRIQCYCYLPHLPSGLATLGFLINTEARHWSAPHLLLQTLLRGLDPDPSRGP